MVHSTYRWFDADAHEANTPWGVLGVVSVFFEVGNLGSGMDCLIG
jgi:hypothetical protein